MEKVRTGHKVSIFLSLALVLGTMGSMLYYYCDLIIKGKYVLDAISVVMIVGGLLLSSAPALILFIMNVIVLNARNPKIALVVLILAYVICCPVSFINLYKDFWFFIKGAIAMMGEMLFLAIIMGGFHLLIIVPIILTTIYCYKTQKYGYVYKRIK
ncbi:MAG: hypothetical protein K5659_09555 [Lachnospiraceae bacterium]|nr:hypothetical protein [Lachnospiraceae bacterium]